MDCRSALRELSEPRDPGETVADAIDRIARKVGLSRWRVFDIWYSKARRIEDAERTAIADAVERHRGETLRHEVRELRMRLTRIESLLVQTDPDFHRPSIDALGMALRRPR